MKFSLCTIAVSVSSTWALNAAIIFLAVWSGGLNIKVLDSLVWQKIALLLTDPKLIREHAERWLNQQKPSNTSIDAPVLEKRLRELGNEQKRCVDAYGKGLLPEALFAEKMRETSKQKESTEQELAKASKNRGSDVKIGIEQLVQKATRKIGELTFEQKKFIIERVVDKIVASPQEVTIWGHIPVPALATTEKVNHVSQYRYCRLAERR